MTAPDPDLDAEIDRLYALPLEGFTAARNALASRLKKEGRRQEAARVQALGKPSVSAWAVNQLHRSRREELDALLSAGGRAREALRGALAGAGPEALRDAMRQQREALELVRREAAELLAAGGHTVNDTVLDRIGTTLQALASDPDAGAAIDRGRLTRDLDPPGFDALAGLVAGLPTRATPPAKHETAAEPAPTPKPEAPAKEVSAAKRRELQAEVDEEAGRQATALRAERARRASQLKKEYAEAKKLLERAETQAKSHATALREAEDRAARMRRAAEAAQAAAVQAEEAAAETRAAAEQVAAKLEAAKAAIENAEAALRAMENPDAK